jgi:hypothetical protein
VYTDVLTCRHPTKTTIHNLVGELLKRNERIYQVLQRGSRKAKLHLAVPRVESEAP